MYRALKKYHLYFAWLLAVAATLVSLYLSTVRNLPVCHFCWYQRICLYPLSILLGIAAYHDDRGIVKYAMPLLILGFLLGFYQYLLQMFPNLSLSLNTCGIGVHCQTIHIRIMKIVTLPFLSMLTSLGIIFLLMLKPTDSADVQADSSTMESIPPQL